MADHFINYSSEEGIEENAKLIDILKDIGPEDELVITMDADDEAQEGYIFDILRSQGFEVMPKGSHDGEHYHIIAHKKRKQ